MWQASSSTCDHEKQVANWHWTVAYWDGLSPRCCSAQIEHGNQITALKMKKNQPLTHTKNTCKPNGLTITSDGCSCKKPRFCQNLDSNPSRCSPPAKMIFQQPNKNAWKSPHRILLFHNMAKSEPWIYWLSLCGKVECWVPKRLLTEDCTSVLKFSVEQTWF